MNNCDKVGDGIKISKVIPGLRELQEKTLGEPTIKIAILDGGTDLYHSTLKNARIRHVNTFHTSSKSGCALQHGTHVTSIILGQRNPLGIAPHCEGIILPIFEDVQGRIKPCSQLNLAQVITQAIDENVHVINISGGQFDDKVDFFLNKAVEKCVQQGILIVSATGNDGCECHHVPGIINSVLTVGASDRNGQPLKISNWGKKYRNHGILALGESIPGAKVGGGLIYSSGTSYATAVVSGIIALFLSLQRNNGQTLDPYKIKDALLTTATPCQQDKHCQIYSGNLNINKAYQFLFDKQISQSSGKGINMSNANGNIESMNQEDNSNYSMEQESSELGVTTSGCGCQVNSQSPPKVQPAEQSINSTSPCQSSNEITILNPCVGKYLPLSFPLQKIYALGTLHYDFQDEARRDGIVQRMYEKMGGGNPFDSLQLLKYLENSDDSFYDVGAITWILNFNSTPLYAIQPEGPFAKDCYKVLVDCLKSQVHEKAERISLPGVIAGKASLMCGMEIPVVHPDIRGIYCWNTETLVNNLTKDTSDSDKDKVMEGVTTLLERMYYELENLGRSSQERAINYAATNAFNLEKIFEETHKQDLHLKSISTEQSSTCRPGSDCWDVKMTFFNPKETNKPLTTYRYTVDVSEPLPVTVGKTRKWHEHS